MMTDLRKELALPFIWAAALIFTLFRDALFPESGNLWMLAGGFAVLFVFIMIAAFSVVRHADELADMLGEPLGTLILTLSVIIIEVSMISAVMLTGSEMPTMARDTVFSVIMIVMNGLVGFALLFGGIRHREQTYNLQGTNTFLAIILPLSVIGLVLPNYTHATDTPTFSNAQAIVIGIGTMGLYAVFLAVETIMHKGYFDHPLEVAPGNADDSHTRESEGRSLLFHTILLLLYLVPVVMLAESIAVPLEHGISELGLPAALGGFIIASLVLAPEGLGAVKSALENRLQRSINIFLGSVTATIGLTIPAVLTISLVTGESIILGLDTEQSLLLVTTLAVSMITYNSGRTNILLGAVHLVLFAAYVLLIFDQNTFN